MYRFSRQVRLSGSKLTAAMGWAVEMTEQVKNVIGLPVNLFSEVYSQAPGTLVWSSLVPDLASLEAATDKLTADSRYSDLAETGNNYVLQGTRRDMLRTIVHPTEPPPPDTPAPEYVTCTYSAIASGQIARAVPVGVEIAERVTQLTGQLCAFEIDATGSYGGVAWLGASASITEMQHAQEALNQDASFVELIDEQAATAFAPGATTQRILRRVV